MQGGDGRGDGRGKWGCGKNWGKRGAMRMGGGGVRR